MVSNHSGSTENVRNGARASSSSSGEVTVQRQDDDVRISNSEAFIHLLKGNFGPGCLNLPYVFVESGWAIGITVLLLVAVQGIYSMCLLVECKRRVQSRTVQTFDDVAFYTFGTKGRRIVQLFLCLVQGGVGCVYIQLIATNVKVLFDDHKTSINIYSAIVGVLMLPFALLRRMKELRHFSVVANLFMIIAVVAAASKSLQVILSPSFVYSSESTFGGALRRNPLIMAECTGSMFFAFEGIGLVMPVENSVKQPSAFKRVLVQAMSCIAVIFMVVSVTCCIAFPTMNSGSITAFLASGEVASGSERAVFQVINGLVTLAVALTFPLQLYPVVEVIEEWFGWKAAPVQQDTRYHLPHHQNQHHSDTQNLLYGGAVEFGGAAAGQPMGPEGEGEGHAAGLDRGSARTGEGSDGQEGSALTAGTQDEGSRAEGPDPSHCSMLPSVDDTCQGILSHYRPATSGYSYLIPRIGVVVTCTLFAAVVADVSLLVSLFGSIGQTGLALMPAAIDLKLQHAKIAPRSDVRIAFDIAVVSFCTFIMIVGTITSCIDIEHYLETDHTG